MFTLFFIMLGPLKMLGPFLQATKSQSKPEVQKIAWQAALIASVALIVCGYIGKSLLINWNIPVPILLLTSGIIFFIVAMGLIIKPKRPQDKANSPPEATGLGTALTMIITPYGAATLISLLAISRDSERDFTILLNILAVMFLNFLSMFFIRQIMGKVGIMIMQLLGVVLGVLQASLALKMIYESIKLLYP
jgi:multiple antibiotic resistance protein